MYYNIKKLMTCTENYILVSSKVDKKRVLAIKNGTSNEMMGLIGMGNNPMVGATVAIAVAVEESFK